MANGKGSRRRPLAVPEKQLAKNWRKTFRKPKPKKKRGK